MNNALLYGVAAMSLVMAAAHAAPPSDAVAWWKAEGNAADATGHGHAGVAQGAPGSVGYAAAHEGQGFSFNGGGYVEVPDAPDLRIAGTVSLSFWVQRRNLGGLDIIVEKGGDWTHGQTNYLTGFHNASFAHAFYFCFAGGCRGVEGAHDTAMHHYAVVASQGAANPSFYIDGVLRATPLTLTAGAATINLAPSARPLRLGAQFDPPYNYYANAMADELMVFNRGLSAHEVLELYNARPVPEPGQWALMGVGLAAIGGLGARRRRRAGVSLS